MPAELLPIVIFPAFFLAIAYTVKVISDNKTRRALIANGATQEAIESLFLQHRAPDYEIARRNGYFAIAIGIAFFIIAMTGLGPGDALTYGLLFLFGGAALVLYYRLRKQS